MGTQSKIALAGFIGNTHDALIVFEGEQGTADGGPPP